jgi:hypothetical protein
MRKFLRDNGLTIVVMSLFAAFLIGQVITGFRVHNDDRTSHGESELAMSAYLRSGHFIEATFENWESEYLQMGFFVLATVYLFQRGSAESRDPDKSARDPRQPGTEQSPWPVKRGGLALRIYENSLSTALLLLFVASFILHAWGGVRVYNEDLVRNGEAPITTLHYVTTSQFWFESFQNWQSELLAIGSLVVFSIVLRQRNSPESKRVEAPHGETGA